MRFENRKDNDFFIIVGWANSIGPDTLTTNLVRKIRPEFVPDLNRLHLTMGLVGQDTEDDKKQFSFGADSREMLKVPDEETADKYMEAIKEFHDILTAVSEDPKLKNYPGIRSYLGFYSKMSQRVLDGHDMSLEQDYSPGVKFIHDMHVDFVDSKGDRVYTLGEIDQFFKDLHFEDISNTSLKCMDCFDRLQDPSISGIEKERIEGFIPELFNKFLRDADYLSNPETVEKISPFFNKVQTNIVGERGAHVNVTAPINNYKGLLEKGWDPSYLYYYPSIRRTAEFCAKADEWFEKVGSPQDLAPLKEKYDKISSFHPNNVRFANNKEFVEYLQNFSDAIKEAREEWEKPEIIDRIDALQKKFGTRMSSPFERCALIGDVDSYPATLKQMEKCLNLREKGITAAALKNSRANYSFVSSAAHLVAGNGVSNLEAYKSVLGEDFFNTEAAEKCALLTGNFFRHVSNDARDDQILVNPYTNRVDFSANNAQRRIDIEEDIELIAQELKRVQANPKMKEYKGANAYISYMQKFVEDARVGGTRYDFMSRLPGCERTMSFADFTTYDKATRHVFTAEEFDGMLTDMGYDKMWAIFDKRCDLEKEMYGKAFNTAENKEYARRVTELNNDLIKVYEHMMSPESEQKYSKFYEHFNGPQGTVNGARGYGKALEMLKEENEALARGWDAARIEDYRVLKGISKSCRNAVAKMAEINDPELAIVEKYMRTLASLDPDSYKFSGREDLDTYFTRYSMAMKDMLAETDKPEMQAKISGYVEKYKLDGESGLSKVLKGSLSGAYDILHGMAERTDISSELMTTFSLEREAEVAHAKEDAEIYRCAETVEDIARRAKEKLDDFSDRLDGLRKTNSDLYDNMRNALEGVSKLSRSNSVEEVNAALENLEMKSETYHKERSSFFKSDKGQMRLDAAADLIKFAKGSKTELAKEVKGTSIEKLQDEKLDEIFDMNLKGARAIVDNIDAAMSYDSTTSKDLQDGFSRDITRRKDLGLDEFTNTLSKIISQKIIDIGIQKKTFTPDTAPSAMQYAANVSQNEHFRNWAKSVFYDPSQRDQLAEMSAGEVYAKYATSRQKEILRENPPRAMAPAAKPKMEKAAAPKPKEAKAQAPKPQAPGK